jgi:hypothetical protein
MILAIASAALSGPLFPFEPVPSGIAEVVAKVPDLANVRPGTRA